MPVTEMLLQVDTRIKRPVYSNRETGFRHPISVHSDMLLFVLRMRPFSNPSLQSRIFQIPSLTIYPTQNLGRERT